MKSRFSTYDLICVVAELQKLVGLRVNQVYDIDSKTYLIRLQQNETKEVLLFESGIRIHTTSFDWPKNTYPSTFSMKMRKHIKNKRLEKIAQLGLDRIVDMQFGSGEAAYHVIVELFDRGNIVFTDYDYVTLNVLRPHTEGEDIRFVVREKYPSDRGKSRTPVPTIETLLEQLSSCKPDDNLKKALTTFTAYGPALLTHVLLKSGFTQSMSVKHLDIPNDIQKIVAALELAEVIVDEAINYKSEGYIIQKAESRKNGEDFYSNQEFHPMVFEQHVTQPHIKFASFNDAVDEFFSTMESQKVEMKGVQQEKVALKKLENVKKDHEKRITDLEKNQLEDRNKAELISRNQELVDSAILAIRQTIASQMSWDDISAIVKEATQQNDPVASVIKKLKLKTNHITLYLTDPYSNGDADDTLTPSLVDIDMDLSAFANAKKYYDHKRQAAAKQQKTLESQVKAFKSAEKKTKQTLKEVKTGVTISKARKVYWFEKFYWFISSENYLVIGGRDQQQNELIVKRYLHSNDIYVHAGITGASSVVIKNPTNDVIPPRTLNEAGTMAMCYSAAWEAKVVTSAWWVNANQVSKTAPTGEYLTTGSFMIRGKKNFLPQCHLIMGFSFMFRLEENSVERHKNERRKKIGEEEELQENNECDKELPLCDDDDEEEEDIQEGLKTIQEQEEEEQQQGSNEYPDFHILVKRKDEGVYIKVMKDEEADVNELDNNEYNEDDVVYLGDDKPVVIKQTKKKNDKDKNKFVEIDQNESLTKHNQKDENGTNDNTKPKQTNQLKRGQKSKLRKIKQKYKDQDEEERELRMKILHGNKNEPKIKKKDKKNKKGIAPLVKPIQSVNVKEIRDNSEKEAKVIVDGDDESEEEAVEPTVTTDVDMLHCLTGQPSAEDELLFAVPVVAPYNALISYKYKVKLTPGTGKRGKASKLALGVFMKDKSATMREKELLKFVKDQDLARNFPGKVKVSAPQLSKVKMQNV